MPAATSHFNSFIMPASPAQVTTRRPGFWSRLFTLLHEARMRQVEREIAFMIERRGGRLTDDLERQIERQLI